MTRLAITGDATTTMEVTAIENGISLFINGVTLIVVTAMDDKPLQIAAPQSRKSLKHIAVGETRGADNIQPVNLPPGTAYIHGRTNIAEERFLIDGLIALGPVRVGRLLDHLGIDPKDKRRRIYTQRLDRMRARGVVAKHPQDKHKRIDFRLVVPNPRVYLSEGQ